MGEKMSLIYDLIGIVVFLVGIGFIVILAFKSVQTWRVKVEIDDGRVVRYANAKEKGRVKKEENGRVQTYILVEYKDKRSNRLIQALIPEHPDYMRIKSFSGGLIKAVVYRVDSNGNAIPYTRATEITVPADKMEYIKTHEMIVNALRTRLVLKNIMLYLAIIIIAVLTFAGFVIWQSAARPIEVVIQQPSITTTTPYKIPVR